VDGFKAVDTNSGDFEPGDFEAEACGDESEVGVLSFLRVISFASEGTLDGMLLVRMR